MRWVSKQKKLVVLSIYDQDEQNYLYMKLPKIQEDEYPLKNTYFTSITEKPVKKYKSEKLVYDWQTAEVEMMGRIPDDEEILQCLIQLQATCKKFEVPHFYTYFFVDSLLSEFESQADKQKPEGKSLTIGRIKAQIEDLKSKKSKWNKIEQLIQLRQNLVGKINQLAASNRLEDVYSHLDDIRFVNVEIVKKVHEWSQANLSSSEIHPFFLHEGNNYLIRMINDNVNVINVLNSKAVKFLSPPNPFYLSRDGNKASMSQTQQTEIDNCMEVLAKAKAQQLRLIINPPKFVSEAKNQTGQLKKLKSQLENEKVEKIKSAYKTSFFNSPSISMRSSLYESTDKNKQKSETNKQLGVSSSKFIRSSDKFKVSKQSENGLEKRNRLQKMIQQKQIAVVSDLKNSQARLGKIHKSNSKDKKVLENKGVNKYLSKVQLLRKSVEQNNKLGVKQKLEPIAPEEENQPTKGQNLMRLSTMSNKKKLPQSVSEIKTPKPKIRLVMEKQSFVEDVIKTFLPAQTIEAYKSLNVRKSASSFYKPSQKQKSKRDEKVEENNIDIKPVTQYSRTLSASHLTQHQFLKGHSKTKNIFSTSMTKKQNKSKSRSLSEKSDLSLSKSPKKRFQNKQPAEVQKDQSAVNNTDAGLRIVNSKLRELTIMSIYGKKSHPNPTLHNPYDSTVNKSVKPENKDSKTNEEQKSRIDEQLREVKSKLKELSIKKIYDRRQSTKGFDKKKQKKQESRLIEKQAEIKKQNKLNQEQLAKKQIEKATLLQNLQKKDQRIEQLVAMLKKQEKVETISNLVEEEQKLREEKIKKLQEIEVLKQKIRSQNKLIKSQMEEEEKKYIELKQKQFQMKEEAMMKKHELDMQVIKQQYHKKNKELEAKIMEEEKIRKEQEIKILKEQREMEDLKMQMEEKRLKQQLLQEVLKEYQQKQEQERVNSFENQELKKERLKREILEKQEIERKILQNFQEDNRKLLEMFEAMKRKNEEAEKENQRKLIQIKKMEQQAQKQQKSLKELEIQLLEAHQVQQIQQSEIKSQQQQNREQDKVEDIQAVRLRVKQQILKEMMAKRKEEEKEERLEKQERARKLAEIEEQIRKQLKRQEQEMDRIQKEEREKYQKIKNELEQEHRKKMEKLENQIKSENHINSEKVEDEPEKIPETNFNPVEISKQQYENELKKSVQISKQQKVQNQLLHNKNQNKDLIQQEEQKRLENSQPQKKQQQAEQIENQQKQKKDPELSQIRDQKKDQPEQKSQKQKMAQPIKSEVKDLQDEGKNEKVEIQGVAEESKKQTQIVKQPGDQILTKYQNLQQYLAKCKQIYIEDKGFPEFVNNFYAQLAPEVKQMMPYTSAEIVKLANSLHRKIDIFEGPSGQSIGWLESQKYVLVGQISCVENIVRKYGQVQIQMTYIFNKTNPYQKQFLAKQVKIFDKVGFIFQKKLKEDNMFSIKLIIKVPTQILPKGFKSPNNGLAIKSKIGIEIMKSSQQKQQNLRYSYSYLLGQTLKHCLSSQQKLEFTEDKSEQGRIIQAKMHYKVYNDSEFKSEEIDDKKMKWEVNLPFKYIQTHDYSCYLMKGSQYSNGSSDKLYTIYINDSLSAVVFTYDKSCEGFSLDVLTNLKTSKIEKQRELMICLPVWRKQEDIRLNYPGPKQFHFSYSVQANFAYGSIINTSILKEEYKMMEAPFAFCLFETNEKGVLMRQLSGEVVEGKDVMASKR